MQQFFNPLGADANFYTIYICNRAAVNRFINCVHWNKQPWIWRRRTRLAHCWKNCTMHINGTRSINYALFMFRWLGSSIWPIFIVCVWKSKRCIWIEFKFRGSNQVCCSHTSLSGANWSIFDRFKSKIRFLRIFHLKFSVVWTLKFMLCHWNKQTD